MLARLVWLTLAVSLLVACSSQTVANKSDGTTYNSSSHVRDNQLLNKPLFVDSEGDGPANEAALRAAGRFSEADALHQLASQPTAVWLTGNSQASYNLAHRVKASSVAAGSVPVFVIYNLPGRDCGQFSNGGAADKADYFKRVGAAVAGIGSVPGPAIVILEPDAVPFMALHTSCMSNPLRASWSEFLAGAIDIIVKQKQTFLYVDAGNATWVKDITAEANVLKRIGIEKANGFALNVANFVTTDASVAYGTELGNLLPVANFVIDTSRNGNPVPSGPGPGPTWCNPPNRKLGHTPTTTSRLERVDALLWIKQPGESDGECNGGPPAGSWWTEAALQLATNSRK